jgi:AI-2 transport protein TqsA
LSATGAPRAPSELHDARLQTWMLGVIAVVLGCAALKATAVVFVPVVLSAFVALLVQPVLKWLERFMHRNVALVIVLSSLVGGFIGIWYFFAVSLQAVAEKGPLYVDRVAAIATAVIHWASARGIRLAVEDLPAADIVRFGVDLLVASVVPFFSALGLLTLFIFTLVLMLLEGNVFGAKLRVGLRDESSAELFATIRSVAWHFQRFFVVKTVISLITGAVTALYLAALGVDFPFLWGAVAFLLNYIPNIGSMIAVVPPTLVALLQFPGAGTAVITLAGLTAVQMTIGNFFDPRAMGRSLSLSPLAVFTSMVFWGWMWGVAGVFLSVQLTVLLKLLFEHVEPLRPLALLIAGEPRPVRARAAAPPSSPGRALEPTGPDDASGELSLGGQ